MREFLNKKRFQFANANLLIACIAILILSFQVKVQAQNPAFPVEINVHVNSPVPPYLPMLEQDLTGGAGSFADRVVGTIRNKGSDPLTVKLYATLERISPAPLSIGLSPSYQAEIPITLMSQEVKPITQEIIYQAFDGFKFSSLVFQGTSLNELKGHGMNYKIPEGTYRLCLDAFDFNVMGKAAPLSLIGTSCGVFQICYSAAAPQIVLPVNSNAGYEFQDYISFSSKISFTWVPPTTTCGAIMPNFNYNLSVYELLEGETINDALYNPPLFQDGNIHNTTYLFDTLFYPNVFKHNHKYIVRVRANILNPQSFLELQNNGFSEISSFTYKLHDPTDDKEDEIAETEDPEEEDAPGGGPDEGGATGDVADQTEEENDGTGTSEAPADAEEEVGPDIDDTGFGPNVCAVTEITVSGSLDRKLTSNDIIRVGDFEMRVDEGATINNGKHKGTGYIIWKPYSFPIHVAVKFEDIKINTEMQLVEGLVKTILDKNFTELKNIETSFANTIKNIKRSNLNSIRARIESEEKKLSQIIDNTSRVHFPVGIEDQKIDGELKGTFLITNIVFSSQGSNMNVYLGIDAADDNTVISLGGSFCAKPVGFSMEEAKVYLVQDKNITIGDNRLTLKAPPLGVFTQDPADKGTYAKWDDEGKFEEVVVNAEIDVSKNYIVPLDPDGNRLDSTVLLKTNFKFKTWDDWIAKIDVTSPFEIAALDGFSIEAGEHIYYDHSEVKNVENFKVPEGYEGKETVDFMGIYIPNLTMKIPNNFTNTLENETTLVFNDFIIDKNGVHTVIAATSVLDIGTGTLGGWGVSIDTVNLAILKNTPAGLMEMKGGIKVPIAEQPLAYSCLLSSGAKTEDGGINFEFSVNPSGPIEFSAWKAYLSISEESKFSIVSAMGKTSIQTEFHGSMGLDISVPKLPKFKFPDLSFENMTIANADTLFADQLAQLKSNAEKIEEELHFFIKSLKFGGQELVNAERGEENKEEEEKRPEIAGFDFTIKKSNLGKKFHSREKKLEVSLSFDVLLDVSFGKAFAVSGTADSLTVSGNLFMNKKPEFGGLDFNQVGLYGKFGPVEVNGSLDFMSDDEKFGDGINGAIDVKFPPGVEIKSRVIMGTKEDDSGPVKYFGLAANVYLESGFAPIGPVVINGFGGGFYNNMEIDKNGLAEKASTTKAGSADNVPLSVARGAMTIEAEVSLSIVSATILKASVVMRGSVSDGGLTKLELKGQGDIFSDGAKASEGFVSAQIEMSYDVKERVFECYAGIDVKLFVATAHIPIWMYAGPKESKDKDSEFDYWLYIGHPGTNSNSKIGEPYGPITVDLIDQEIGSSSVYLGGQAYFCTGTTIPPIPQLPQNVASHLNRTTTNNSLISVIQESMGGNNPGFMFGARVTGDLNLQLAMFYASIEATVGFDVDVRRYSNAAECKNPTTGEFGLNDWYGLGQMYAYLNLDVGFRVNVWFYKGNVSLATFGTGAIFEAGLPNPTWMRGDVRIRGSVLNGLIKINANCTVEVGEPCIPSIDPLDNIQLISEVGPEGDDASVFANPYIVFSMPMEETVIDIKVPSNDPKNSEPVERRYKFKVEALTITKKSESGDKEVDGFDHRYNDDRHALTLATTRAFDPNSKYEIFVKCSAHEYDYKTEKWGHPKEHKENGLVQDTTIYYYTGDAPDTIAEKHIVYSYPLNGQNYLLKHEFNSRGIIKIDKHVDEYFNGGVNGYDYFVTFVDQGPRVYPEALAPIDPEIPPNLGDIDINPVDLTIPIIYKNPESQPYHYNEGTREISYDIPDLKNDRVYEVYFIVKDRGASERIERSKDIDLVLKEEDQSTETIPGSGGKKGDDLNDRFDNGKGGVFTSNYPPGGGKGGRGNSGDSDEGSIPNPTYQNPDHYVTPGFNGGGGGKDPSGGNKVDGFGIDFIGPVSGVDDRPNPSNPKPETEVPSPPGAITDTFTLVGHELSTYAVGKSERVIYKMTITTSKYSTILEKLESYTGFSTTVMEEATETVGNSSVSYTDFEIKSTSMSEAFDSFELYGYKKTVGEGNSTFTIKTPALLNASIVYNPSNSNDNKMNQLYNKVNELREGDFSVKLGANIVRRPAQRSGGAKVIPSLLIDGVKQEGVLYTLPNGHQVYDLQLTDVNKSLIIKNDRDKYYANDYVLMQRAANHYFNNVGEYYGSTGFGFEFNSSTRLFGNDDIGGTVTYTGVILSNKYQGLMNEILNLDYTQMKASDLRKVQFEYGYSMDMYDYINAEYKTENDNANEPIGKQVPNIHKVVKNVIKDIN